MTRHKPQADITGFRTGGIAERYADRTANWSPMTSALGGLRIAVVSACCATAQSQCGEKHRLSPRYWRLSRRHATAQ